MNALESRLLASPSLPTLPRVAQRVLELARRDDADLGELARAIGTDPALATKLLRLINSPMYRMTREVTSLRDAALYLGMNAVKSVALSFSLIHKLRGGGDGSTLLDALWRASLLNALAARRLAREVGGWDPEEAFLVGLIADSGVLVLLKGVDGYAGLVSRFLAGERDLLELERAELETDHVRIAWLLLEKWGFPESTRALVAAHHHPDSVALDAAAHKRAHVLSVAWLCTRALSVRGFAVETATLDARVASALGIPKARALELVAELPGELREAAAFFDIALEDQLGFPELLEEANSRLADSALASDRESTELAAAASAELEERTRELSPALEYDAATSMICENSFQALVEAHQLRARRRHAPLSVLVFEVAGLKDVASERGAAALNELLAQVGARTLAALRPTDPSGRVGGDRIGALLVGCSRDAAFAAAERLRVALERVPVPLRGGELQLGVTIGVAGLRGDEVGDERNLLSAALAALDRARESAEPISL